MQVVSPLKLCGVPPTSAFLLLAPMQALHLPYTFHLNRNFSKRDRKTHPKKGLMTLQERPQRRPHMDYYVNKKLLRLFLFLIKTLLTVVLIS